jgi:hypothetical protein
MYISFMWGSSLPRPRRSDMTVLDDAKIRYCIALKEMEELRTKSKTYFGLKNSSLKQRI